MDPPGIYIKFIEITKPNRLIDLRYGLHVTDYQIDNNSLMNWGKI